MTKIITFYNNKGGVSKTTTLFNLAAYLAQRGNRVLIADCDPQCNLTEIFFASSEIIADPERELPGTSIYQAIKGQLSGDSGRFDSSEVKLVQSEVYEDIYLLKGDLEFYRAENRFVKAWNSAITEDIHEKNVYAVLYRLFHSLGSDRSFDYILCDVGPSTDAITRAVFLACDGFFLPLIPNRFGYQAVQVLSGVLREWVKKHEEISRTFQPFKLDPFPGNPMFLGLILQNFKISRSLRAESFYRDWQDRIENLVITSFLSEDALSPGPHLRFEDPVVATISDVGPLAPVSLMLGRAIFDVHREDAAAVSSTRYGDEIWGNWEDRREEYRREISKIAEALP